MLVQRRSRRDEPMKDEHADVRARIPRGDRLVVGPQPEDRVGLARVVLGDDGDADGAS
jgi:hypothetical protein